MNKSNSMEKSIYIGLIVALLSVSAFIRIPIYPISITLQTFIIFLIPLVFGSKISFISVLIYFLLGLLGLPIFSSGGGLSYIFMPTFGYLVGFLISVIVSGYICRNNKNTKSFIIASIVSIIIIYTCGVIGVYININFIQDKKMLFSTIFASCILFFILDLIKLFLAIIVAPYLLKVIESISNRT